MRSFQDIYHSPNKFAWKGPVVGGDLMNETEKQFHSNPAQELVCHQHNGGYFT